MKTCLIASILACAVLLTALLATLTTLETLRWYHARPCDDTCQEAAAAKIALKVATAINRDWEKKRTTSFQPVTMPVEIPSLDQDPRSSLSRSYSNILPVTFVKKSPKHLDEASFTQDAEDDIYFRE